MINRTFTVLMLLAMLASFAGSAQAITPASPEPRALIYVHIGSPDDLTRFALTGLPMYSLLENGLLTGTNPAGQGALSKAGLSFEVVDPDTTSASYYLAQTHPSRSAPDYSLFGQVLLTLPDGVLLRMDVSQVDALAQAGAELKHISLTPKSLPQSKRVDTFPEVIDPDPLISLMIDQVTETQVYTYDRQLAGELPVWVDGGWYTITTRQTYSGTPIQKTTNFVGQHMASLGLNVEYHQWNTVSNPNVIGEIPGLVNPEDIFIIGAHIDDVSGTPGADDNASGSVATLLAADILSEFDWGCTLRFAFWTGEEQGLLGSDAYASHAAGLGENIVGYLNLDMIAYNTVGSARGIDLRYNASMPPTLELAQLFADVVSAYNLNLIPDIGTSLGGGSDHSSFWNQGYTAILAIEDQGDFNPYYHGSGDTPAHTDRPYFTDFVKASLGTFAHMSGCLLSSGLGTLEGHVTAASGGAPIQGAQVTAVNSQGGSLFAFTDETGFYSRTLVSDTYTVTASAYSYLPVTVTGVEVISDTITTQDFSLLAAPTHTVSGTVTESVTGLPLLAEISFDGSPTVVWSDPSTGYYEATLPENFYTMHVKSNLHLPLQWDILLDHDQTQNFSLDPLPCILLVDDDQNGPDVLSYYTSALDANSYDYTIWDVEMQGSPTANDLFGYQQVLWFNGYPYSGTFTGDDEAAVASYLDDGGNFFLSSQDYLYDFGLTPFGQDYLHISNFTSDINQTTVTGQNAFSGLGPYALSYPFTNYSDIVNPDSMSQVSFAGNQGNAAVSYEGDFNTVFLGFPLEAIPQAGRTSVMERLVDGFFGGCEIEYGFLDGYVTDVSSGAPLEGASVTVSPLGKAGILGLTDPNGYYTMTLPADDYMVSASLAGYETQSQPATIITDEITHLNFAMQPVCEPVSNLAFSWDPSSPYNGDPVTFTASASGTEPIDFLWSFSDTYTSTGDTVVHAFMDAGDYTVSVAATNACTPVSENLSHQVSILPKVNDIFLPIVIKP